MLLLGVRAGVALVVEFLVLTTSTSWPPGTISRHLSARAETVLGRSASTWNCCPIACASPALVEVEARTSDELSAVRFIPPADLADYKIHPSIRIRIDHYREHRPGPYIG